MAFENVSVELTMNGASGDVDGIFELDPMCMQSTVSVSSHAEKNGAQCSWSCTEGNPRGCGFSLNVTARLPFPAHRRTSSPASFGSHSGIIVTGNSRPRPSPPHHSSRIQSL